jgi:hypothetical protein
MDAALIYTLLHLLHLYTLFVEIYPILRSIMHGEFNFEVQL